MLTGKLKLISEQTASGSASISFTSGIDNTYPIYKFEFINLHPATDDVNLQFNLSTSMQNLSSFLLDPCVHS